MRFKSEPATVEGVQCICVYSQGIGYREVAYFINEKDAELFLATLEMINSYEEL